MGIESAIGDFVIGRAGTKTVEGIALEITRAASHGVSQELRIFIPGLSNKHTKVTITSDTFSFVRRDPMASIGILSENGFKKQNGVWAAPVTDAPAEPLSMPVKLARPADKDIIPGLEPFTFSRLPSP